MKLPVNEPKVDGAPASAEGNAPQAAGSNNAEPDFSEFLWMENEEEFDQQVMRELIAEEEFNYYSDKFCGEDQEDEREAHMLAQQNIALAAGMSLALTDQQEADDLRREFNRVVLLNSNLNPNAPAFVPNPNAPEFVPSQARRNDNDAAGFSS